MRAVLLVCLCAVLSFAQKPDPEKLFNEAMAAQHSGDLQAAIADYLQVLRLDPTVAGARVNMAAAEMQLGRTDDALREYRAALKQEPRNAGFLVLYGNALFELSRYQETIELLTPARKEHPKNMKIAFLLGESLIRVQRPQQGIALVEEVARTGDDANAYTLAAVTYLQLAEYKKASACADQAVRIEPNDPEAWTLDGMTKAGIGDIKAAEQAYRRVLTLSPEDYQSNLRLGTLLLRVDQDPQAAKPFLERALQAVPNSLAAHFELAKAQAAVGLDAAAIRGFEQIEKAVPNTIEPHLQLSILYARAKRKEDAKRERAIVDRLSGEQTSALNQRPSANPEDELSSFTAPAPLK